MVSSGMPLPALYVSLPHATFLLVFGEEGKAVLAPDIARWALGKDREHLERYYRRKNATLEWI